MYPYEQQEDPGKKVIQLQYCNDRIYGSWKINSGGVFKYMFAMEVVEMDQEIVKEEGMSIPDIFATYGEEYFRNCETELLKKMQSRKNVLISCGGGVVLRECNVEQMKKNGRVVLLTASPEEVYERVKDSDDRPVLAGRKNVKGIAELMEARREKYEAAAILLSIRITRLFFRCVKS